MARVRSILFLEEDSLCARCRIKQQHYLEKERVVDFLAGLNRNLDEVWGRLVARDPFPLTEEAFAEVQCEEAHWKVVLTKDTLESPLMQEGSALVSTKSHPHGHHHADQRANKRPWCEHCNCPGHTQDKCWVLHGKPANWQPRKKIKKWWLSISNLFQSWQVRKFKCWHKNSIQ